MRPSLSLCVYRLIVVLVTAIAPGLWMASCQPVSRKLTVSVCDAEDGRTISVAQVHTGDTAASVDPRGRFELVLNVGTHLVEVMAPGYQTEVFSVTIHDASTAFERDVYLRRPQLRGRVLDELSGQPIAAAQVSYGQKEATTDMSGVFQLPAVAPARLLISSPGYTPLEVSAGEIETWLNSAGTPVQPVSVSLTPRVLIGTVRESGSRQPILGVRVSSSGRVTHSDAGGDYQLRYVELGSEVSFASADYATYKATYTGQSREDAFLEPREARAVASHRAKSTPPDATPASEGSSAPMPGSRQATPVPPPPDAPSSASREDGDSPKSTEGGDVSEPAVPASPQLAGELHDAVAGEPISGAVILAYPSGDAAPDLLLSDGEGRFVAEKAPSLSRIVVKAPGYRRATVPITQAGALSIALEPFAARGIYIPFGRLTQPDRIAELLDLVQRSGELNAVVVDVKSDRARIAWPSENPLALEVGAYQRDVMDLREFLRACQAKGIYTIARMVVFKDHLLAPNRPEWAIKMEDGALYVDREGLHWVDPFQQPVRDYNIALAHEVAAMGFDEIQFDYVRFPDIRGVHGLVYREENTLEGRTAAVTQFCAQAHESLRVTPAFVSLDIFGLNVWLEHPRDNGIGQRIDDVAPHLDYVSPMLYPSLFGPGNLGLENPALHPYEVIYRSVSKTIRRTDTLVRPWLQHYSLGGIIYDTTELLRQKQAAEDAGSSGWLFWNAGGKYRPEIFGPDAYSLLDDTAAPAELDKD